MKRKVAFTLAEIIIAVTFVGIIACLTMPSLVNGLKAKTYRAAYTEAFKKVKEVASMTRPTNGLEPTGQQLWKALNDSLSVTGYSAPSETLGQQSGVIIKEDELKPAAIWEYVNTGWQENCSSTKVGIKTSDNVARTTVGMLSPWIVTQNNMAFAVDFNQDRKNSVGFSTYDCADTIYISNATSYRNAHSYACGVVIVDINGLDKGPNKPRKVFDADDTSHVMNETDLDDEIVKYDRFYIYIGKNGNVIPGPKGSLEYWIAKKNRINMQ